MKKLLIGVFTTLALLSTLFVLAGTATSVQAVRKVGHTNKSTNWSCNDTHPLVWSPGNNSWYHVISCIREDSLGNVVAQVRATHSSGPVYTKFCQIAVDVYAHNAGWFDNDYLLTSSPWKQYPHCGAQLSETVSYSWHEALTHDYSVYLAYAEMGSSGYSYSHYLRYNR